MRNLIVLTLLCASTLPAQTLKDCAHMWNPQATCSIYTYSVPDAVGGIGKIYLDIFNASGSGRLIRIISVFPFMKTDIPVVGIVGMRWDMYRTNSAGTGGTAAVYKSPTPDVAGGSISPFVSSSPNLPAQITARHMPSAGANIVEWFGRFECSVEETLASTYICGGQTNFLADNNQAYPQYITLKEGEGFVIKQGPVASLNNVGFRITFSVE